MTEKMDLAGAFATLRLIIEMTIGIVLSNAIKIEVFVPRRRKARREARKVSNLRPSARKVD